MLETKLLLNYTVAEVFSGRGGGDGDLIGVELELEGRNVGLQDIATRGWNRHQDGSLRGEAIEYVTNGGKKIDSAKKLVCELFEKFKEHKVRFNSSIRTSTHIHLNFNDKPVKAVVNFFALFTVLEELLQYYSGEDRKGNLFCITTREADGIIGVLATALGNGDFSRFAGDRYKYAACNLSSLYKFGTVEVRTMRGATSAEQVNAWIDILYDMYIYATTKMKSPVDIVRDLSHIGAEALVRQIFSASSYKNLMSTFPAIKTLHHSLMEGVRLLQVFAYQFEEDFLAEVKIDRGTGKKRADAPVLSVRMDNGNSLSVWKPNGQPWICRPMIRGARVWLEGMVCSDEPRLRFNQATGRFDWHKGNGAVISCRWRQHPTIPEQPRPVVGDLDYDQLFDDEGWEDDDDMMEDDFNDDED